jgi:predicted DNA-binding WGR domain protein
MSDILDLVKLEDKSATFWCATQRGSTIIITAGVVGTKGKQIFKHTYRSHGEAMFARGERAAAMRSKGYIDADDAPKLKRKAPSQSRPSRSASLPSWWKTAPRDQVARLTRIIETNGLAHRRDDILSLVSPSIRLRARRANAQQLDIASRFGGLPNLPLGTKWPRHRSAHLTFIAQLRLDELARLDIARRLPRHGLLSVFVENTSAHDSYLSAGVLLYFPSLNKLRPLAPPDTDDIQAVKRPSLITGEIELTLPEPESALVSRLKLTEAEHKRYWDDLWLRLGDGPRHQLLGHADVASGSGEHLLRIDSDDRVGMEFGDAQPWRVYLAAGALGRADFRKARFSADE